MTPHANQNNSKILAVVTLIIYAAAIFLAYHFKVWPPVFAVAGCGVLSVGSAGINFLNTVETNDNWKTWLAAAAIILTVICFAIPISVVSVA